MGFLIETRGPMNRYIYLYLLAVKDLRYYNIGETILITTYTDYAT